MAPQTRRRLTSRSRPWSFSEFQSLARKHEFENEIDGGKAVAVAAAMKATIQPIDDGLIPPGPHGSTGVQQLNPRGGSAPSDASQKLVGLKLTLMGSPRPVLGIAALTTPRRRAALGSAASLECCQRESPAALRTGV